MKKHNVYKTIKNLASIVGVLVLVLLVYKTSSILISNSLTENYKIDKTTSSYLSFNYAGGTSEVFEINNPKKVSDFNGKLFAETFDFEVTIPEEYITGEKVEYEIVVKDMGNKIDGKFVKMYLTNQSDKAISGFEKTVPVYTALTDCIDGKVIYTGAFTKDDLEDKYRLRVWISKSYEDEIKSDLAYQISVKIK